MSLNGGLSQNDWYEKIAAEFIKYECFTYSGVPNKKIMAEMNKAYTEIAEKLGIADMQAAKTEISNMKKYVSKEVRRCVRLSIINRGGGEDALNYAPHWFKSLDQRLKLLEVARKMETLQSYKCFIAGKRVGRFTSELVRCVCRAAARELARDYTDEGAGEPSGGSMEGGDRGPAGDSTGGEVGEFAMDSTTGRVGTLGTYDTTGGVRDLARGTTNRRGGDGAIDSSERAARAAAAFTSEEAVREYADRLDVAAGLLHSIWVRIYAQSIHKLMLLIAVGDKGSKSYAPIDWLAIDAGLLYDTSLTVVVDKTFQSSVTLNPLILLYKLMVAAHKKINEMKTLPDLTTQSGSQTVIGAQSGTQENSYINIPSSSDKSIIPDKDTSEKNSVGEMRVDRNESNEFESKSARDICERERAKHIWALVHVNYIVSGRSSSAILLQRRWHEMKQWTRQLLTSKDPPLAPPPILLALAKQFPCVLTEKLPPWSDLVLDNLIYQDSELEPYRRLYAGIRLEVPQELGENLILDDLYDWSDDEVEIINENRETITVPDSEDEETDKETNEQTDTRVNNTKIDDNTSELNDENDIIKKLESIDPTKAKIKIIFENDSDDDLNDVINGEKEPNTSEITNSNVTPNVNEGLDLKCREIISESDDIDLDQNILNTNNTKQDAQTKNSKLNNIKNNEDNNRNVSNSVSNEIEPKVRPNNRDQNIGTDMDEVISDLRNKLIKGPSKDSNNLVIQFKDTLQNYLTSKVDEVDDENISDYLVEFRRGDESCNDSDESSSDDEGERPDPLLVDEKLVKLSRVVLTPIEDLPEWRKLSRNNIIHCRRFSVKNFSKKVHVTSEQLKNCRPYIPKKSTNGIWIRKNQELRQIPKDIRRKINFLSKRLNLSRTNFSREFWSERNLELLELCRPFSIQLKTNPRVIKKIELTDIDEVRRINKTILTAQVAPITVEANRMFVTDSLAPSTTTERIQHRPTHNSTDDENTHNKYKTQKTNLSSNLTVVQENEKIADFVGEKNLPEDKTPKNLDSKSDKDELLSESDVKEMIKTIVRKGDLPKATDTAYSVETQDLDYFSKQKQLERDLRQISKLLLTRLYNTKNETPNKRNVEKKVTTQPNPTTKQKTLDSLEEWKKQKEQNLIYFNLNPDLDVNERKGKNVKQYRNKKKNLKKDQSNVNKDNTEVILHKESDSSQSKDTCEVSDSSDCNEKVIKRTSCEPVSEAAIKNPRLEIKDEPINAQGNVIELSDDSNDEALNNHNKTQININIIQNTIQINGCGSNEQNVDEKNMEHISLLSKLGGNMQKNVAPLSPQNNNVFYVAKNSEINATKTMLDSNGRGTVIETKSTSSSMYYVVDVPDHLTGPNKTLISPLPDSPGLMPVIQSVSSLSQLSHQSLNQIAPIVINSNQASLNQTQPLIYICQSALNQTPPSIDLNQHSLTQLLPQNQISQNQIQPQNQISPNPNQVVSISTLPSQIFFVN